MTCVLKTEPMDITIQELKQKLDNKEEFVFIDVREPYEYEEFNLGAKLIPLGAITHAIDELEDHKEDEIVIHCRSGARSAAAQNVLQQAGFSNVRNLVGGVLAWQQEYK
jgi:rhodanese-related sulfurtransferase